MSEKALLVFEQWRGRRLRLHWIVIWTSVFLATSAYLFSAIPFGQAEPKVPTALEMTIETLNLCSQALERTPERNDGYEGAEHNDKIRRESSAESDQNILKGDDGG